jgi:hypothetical protein
LANLSNEEINQLYDKNYSKKIKFSQKKRTVSRVILIILKRVYMNVFPELSLNEEMLTNLFKSKISFELLERVFKKSESNNNEFAHLVVFAEPNRIAAISQNMVPTQEDIDHLFDNGILYDEIHWNVERISGCYWIDGVRCYR